MGFVPEWAALVPRLEDGPPPPWRRTIVAAVGDLTNVGFVRDTERLLVISSRGRGLFDCETGALVAREPDPGDDSWFDPRYLEAAAIGPDAQSLVRTSGLAGGGLPNATRDGWSILRLSPQWPEEDVVLQRAHSALYMETSQPGRHLANCFAIAHESEIRACGFSHSGLSLVLATSSDLTCWTRTADDGAGP